MQVDWAGSTIPYIEAPTGEEKVAYIFVSVLPASAYPFAYAYGDMKQPNWIDAHVRAFEHYGGVPRVVIPDNTKTAVKTPDLVDPLLNASYTEMARHYGVALVPARPRKPKDKAADENMVGNVSRRIIAALRNRRFFSVMEINQAIAIELDKLINRPFQKLEGNRKTAFEAIDKPALKPLPAARYEYADWADAKVAFNYHVEYQGFFLQRPLFQHWQNLKSTGNRFCHRNLRLRRADCRSQEKLQYFQTIYHVAGAYAGIPQGSYRMELRTVLVMGRKDRAKDQASDCQYS
ncbi:IS21 family transposase [Anoxybacterium hadale]|uniref:IS21 family transposase n=1 Tax=Anoxybacterium hadale TaxID=3408580 RepID=A0ACD1AHS0_9FIRM|nr:IS21 family transposase [Clostridiales bacterium]